MQANKLKYIYQVLRIATAMCFIGHGMFGIITKEIWCNYFAVFGIGRSLAYQLMPVLGAVDVLLGLVVLFYPVRAVPAWLIFWGLVTAMLRPLSGEPVAEFVERAGNYGAPFCLLLLTGFSWSQPKNWFAHMEAPQQVDTLTITRLSNALKVVVTLLLLGHGWLNIIQKASLLKQYASLGFSNPAQTAFIIGIAEVAASLMVLVKPLRPLVFVLFVWKMGSELFYPHFMVFEWIERGGSYGALLALWMITERQASIGAAEKNYSLQQVV